MDPLDDAVNSLRAELVADAPSVYRRVDDTRSIHAIRLAMRAADYSFRIHPTAPERVLGVRAFVEPESLVMVTSIVADMREHVRTPFDIARWCIPRGFFFEPLGLLSWLFPLEISLRRGHDMCTVDVVVVTQDATDAAKLS